RLVSERALLAEMRAALTPLGAKQRGHSGVFIADHGFWLALVEVKTERQLLTVGAHWLWFVQSRHCFDCGERLPFNAGNAARMAADAVASVSALRSRLRSLAAIARELAAPVDGFWPLYHAGVAAALAGDKAAARQHFARIAAKPADRDWQIAVRAAARSLDEAIGHAGPFQAQVEAIVVQTRTLQGLPPGPVRFT
ncbi:MAG: hypothetical protein ACREFQ_01600, partial [Stellaceae bacterium]